MSDLKNSSKFKISEFQSQQFLGYLKDSRLFNHLPEHLLEQISQISRIEHYAQKEIILKENEMNDRVFFLSQGHVGIYLKDELIIRLYRKGDLFGEINLINSKPNAVSILAETEVELFSISIQQLDQQTKLDTDDINPAFHRIFALMLADKLELTTAKAWQEASNHSVNKNLLTQKQAALTQTEEALEEKTMELKKTQSHLEQSSKFVTIGELVSGIAHDLNQPLLYMRSHAQMELSNEKGVDQKTALKVLSIIEKGTDRMMELIDHLKEFSLLSSSDFTEVDLKKVLDNALLLCREQMIIETVEVVTNYTPQLLLVSGNPIQLEQVFINLINNAKDAFKETEERILTISIRIEQVDEKSKAVIVFQDNGIGMDMATKEKIFAPFFTTKEADKHMGVGLSICYALVQSHQGTIDVKSEKESKGSDGSNRPGGTTVEVVLPILD